MTEMLNEGRVYKSEDDFMEKVYNAVQRSVYETAKREGFIKGLSDVKDLDYDSKVIKEVIKERITGYLKAATLTIKNPETPMYDKSIKCINESIKAARSNITGMRILNEGLDFESGTSSLSNPQSYFIDSLPEELAKYDKFATRAEEVKRELKENIDSESLEMVGGAVYEIVSIAEEEGISKNFSENA